MTTEEDLPPLALRVKVTRRLGDSLIARRDFKHDAVFRDPAAPHWLDDDDKFVDIAMNPVVSWEHLPLEGESR